MIIIIRSTKVEKTFDLNKIISIILSFMKKDRSDNSSKELRGFNGTIK